MDKNELWKEPCRRIKLVDPVERARLSPREEHFLFMYRALDTDGRNAVLSKMNELRMQTVFFGGFDDGIKYGASFRAVHRV